MNFKDVLRLLVFYSRQTGASSAKVKDVIGRSAIVLITAYWEASCEDLVDEALTHLAIHSPGPEDLGVELRKVIAKEIKREANELAIWELAGDNWRLLLERRRDRLRAEMNALNTPKRDPVDQFFLRGLGIERISEAWSWDGMTSTEAADKLDQYVTLRGEIAHRGGSANRVTKSTVKDYAAHIRRLSLRTATLVNDRMWEATGKSLLTREVEAEDRRQSLQTVVPEATSADSG